MEMVAGEVGRGQGGHKDGDDVLGRHLRPPRAHKRLSQHHAPRYRRCAAVHPDDLRGSLHFMQRVIHTYISVSERLTNHG